MEAGKLHLKRKKLKLIIMMTITLFSMRDQSTRESKRILKENDYNGDDGDYDDDGQ